MLSKLLFSILLCSNVLLASGILKLSMGGSEDTIVTTFKYKDSNNAMAVTKDRCESSMHIINGEVIGVATTDSCIKFIVKPTKLKEQLQQFDVHQTSTEIKTQLTLKAGNTTIAGVIGKNASLSAIENGEETSIDVVVSNNPEYVLMIKDYVSFMQRTSPVNMDWLKSLLILENGYVLLKSNPITILDYKTRHVNASEVALPNDIASKEEAFSALNRSGSEPTVEKTNSISQEPQENEATQNIIEESDEDQSIEAI